MKGERSNCYPPIPETADKRPTVLSCNLNHKFSLIYLLKYCVNAILCVGKDIIIFQKTGVAFLYLLLHSYQKCVTFL